MEASTSKSLKIWINARYGTEDFDLMSSMINTYATDAEFYKQVGWQRCFDDTIAARRGRDEMAFRAGY